MTHCIEERYPVRLTSDRQLLDLWGQTCQYLILPSTPTIIEGLQFADIMAKLSARQKESIFEHTLKSIPIVAVALSGSKTSSQYLVNTASSSHGVSLI